MSDDITLAKSCDTCAHFQRKVTSNAGTCARPGLPERATAKYGTCPSWVLRRWAQYHLSRSVCYHTNIINVIENCSELTVNNVGKIVIVVTRRCARCDMFIDRPVPIILYALKRDKRSGREVFTDEYNPIFVKAQRMLRRRRGLQVGKPLPDFITSEH